MNGREWDLGAVAMVVNVADEEKVARFVGSWGELGQPHWVFADGSTLLAHEIRAARPLVVIDPEDREAVERLLRELHAQRIADPAGTVFGHTVESAQAALREYANPKREVFRHYVTRKDGGLQTAHCGKVWRANAEANVVNRGDCPECVALVAEGWSL